MGNIKWPAISQGDLIVAAGWLVSILVGMNVIDSQQSESIFNIASSLIAAAWLIAHGITRKGRNEVLAAHIAKGNTAELPHKTLVG